MILVNPEIEQYSSSLSLPLPDEAIRIYEQTIATHPHAHLMSSILQGQYLAFISKMMEPLYILEIGTFTGFSTLCLAEGLNKKGELHTIELRDIDYYELVLPALNKGGMIIADNVLFHGKVVDSSFKDKNTKAIDEFNRHVNNDLRTHQLIVPIRDGMMMIKKNNYEE